MKKIIHLAVIILLYAACSSGPEQHKKEPAKGLTSMYIPDAGLFHGYNEGPNFVGKDPHQRIWIIGDSLKAINILWNELEKSRAANERVWSYYHSLLKTYKQLKQAK